MTFGNATASAALSSGSRVKNPYDWSMTKTVSGFVSIVFTNSSFGMTSPVGLFGLQSQKVVRGPGGAAGSFRTGLVPGLKRFCRAQGIKW